MRWTKKKATRENSTQNEGFLKRSLCLARLKHRNTMRGFMLLGISSYFLSEKTIMLVCMGICKGKRYYVVIVVE